MFVDLNPDFGLFHVINVSELKIRILQPVFRGVFNQLAARLIAADKADLNLVCDRPVVGRNLFLGARGGGLVENAKGFGLFSPTLSAIRRDLTCPSVLVTRIICGPACIQKVPAKLRRPMKFNARERVILLLGLLVRFVNGRQIPYYGVPAGEGFCNWCNSAFSLSNVISF